MEAFLSGILRISFFGSLAAVLLLLLRPVLCRLAGWSAVYYLWLPVLFRFCIPIGITVTLPAVSHMSAAYESRGDASSGFLEQNHAESGIIIKTEDTGQETAQRLPESADETSGVPELSGIWRWTSDVPDLSENTGWALVRPEVLQIPAQAAVEPDIQASASRESAADSGQADASLKHHSNAGRPERTSDTESYSLFQMKRFWLFLWGCGALACICWHIFASLHYSRRVQKSLREASKKAQEILKESGHSGRISVAESSLVNAPMLLGILHPVIVLPANINSQKTGTDFYSGQEDLQAEDLLRNIIAHELVHARRQDLLYKWLVTIAGSLHWFNPLMILIRREISRSCELSCDEAVIRGMSAAQRRCYGQTLLAMAAPLSGTVTPAASLSGEKEALKERLVTIAGYRRKGIPAVALSILPVLAVSGCAFISNAQPGRTKGIQSDGITDMQVQADGSDLSGADQGVSGSGDDSKTSGVQADGEVNGPDGGSGPGSGSSTGSGYGPNGIHAEGSGSGSGSDEAGAQPGRIADTRRYLTQSAADDYRAVLTSRKQIDYYDKEQYGGQQDKDSAKQLNLTEILDLFSPDSSFVQISEFAVVDFDGDEEAEVLLHITDVAGDLGGFAVLRRLDGRVQGYPEHYKCISNLKTDGTFSYMPLAGPDDGIGSVRFQDYGCSIELSARSETSEDFKTVTYWEGGRTVSAEQYEEVLKRQSQKPDAAWYKFTEENIYSQMQPFKGSGQDSEAVSESGGQERFYVKDDRQYELVQDLVSGRSQWASVTVIGSESERAKQEEQEKQKKLGKTSHTDKYKDYSRQERYFEKLDGSESYQVRRWDNLRYSAGEYLVFEYNGTMHVSKSTDLYHPVLSYDYGGTYGIITKVPQGYMTADSSSYEIRFYDEQFRETKVITGMRAGESGHYYENGLMAVRDMKTGLIGYMDLNGEMAVPCSYAIASDFSNGFASVLTGAEIIPFTEDAGTVQLFYGKGGQWGIIDRKGKFVLEPSEQYANESPDSPDEQYDAGVRRFGPVRADGTADFIASDQNEKVLETVSVW